MPCSEIERRAADDADNRSADASRLRKARLADVMRAAGAAPAGSGSQQDEWQLLAAAMRGGCTVLFLDIKALRLGLLQVIYQLIDWFLFTSLSPGNTPGAGHTRNVTTEL